MKTILVLLIFTLFSTIFHNSPLLDNFGGVIGKINIYIFGNFAYINVLIWIYPLYKLNSDKTLYKNIDFYLGWVLLFISLIILQSLIFNIDSIGLFSREIYTFFESYTIAIVILFIISFALSLIFLIDDNFKELKVKSKIEGIKLSSKNTKVNNSKEDSSPLKTDEFEAPVKVIQREEKEIDENVEIKKVKEDISIINPFLNPSHNVEIQNAKDRKKEKDKEDRIAKNEREIEEGKEEEKLRIQKAKEDKIKEKQIIEEKREAREIEQNIIREKHAQEAEIRENRAKEKAMRQQERELKK